MPWRSAKSRRAITALCLLLALGATVLYARRVTGKGRLREAVAGRELVVAALGNWDADSRLAWQGLELAAGAVNRAGGVGGKPVRLWRQDMKDDVRRGVELAKDVAAHRDTALAIVSARQNVALPAATVLAYYRVPTMLTQISTTRHQVNLPLLFHMRPSDADELAVLVKDGCVPQRIKRVALVVFNGAASQSHANTFETEARLQGLEIAGRIPCDQMTTEEDFRDKLASLVRNSRFDAIFYSGPPRLSADLLKAAAKLGIGQPFLGASLWDTPKLEAVADPRLTSVYLVTPFAIERPSEASRPFIEAYRQAYGEDPDAQAAIDYNALVLYAQAARRAGSADPDAVAAALMDGTHWDSPFGNVRINDLRELVIPDLSLKHFVNGTFQILDPKQPENRN